MKTRLKRYAGALLMSICILSCTKPDDGKLVPELDSAGCFDVSLDASTATTATFSGELHVHPEAGKSFKAGILYSTSQKVSEKSARRQVLENPVEGPHSLTIEGLTFGTKYYYASYVYRLGKYELSEVKSFVTETIQVDTEVSDVQYNEVAVTGQVLVDEDAAELISVIFMFSDTPDFESESTLEALLELDEEGRFLMRVSGLQQNTRYYYNYCIKQGSRTQMGVPVEVVTLNPYQEAFAALDANSAVDLSADGFSNSYIVPASGLYKFKTVKGNSNEPVGDVASVLIQWETTGTAGAPQPCCLIDGTFYADGYAIIRVPDAYLNGNALIAAKDSNGTILWSWHLWLTDQKIREHQYASDAGIMMDRNLGALSMEKGDPKGFGLLYQWGRKDPFPGAATTNGAIMAGTTAYMSLTLSGSETGTVRYSSENPTTFILADPRVSTDWLYPVAGAGYGNERWMSEKTIYDPCPPGWRVPDGGPKNGLWFKAGVPTGGGFPYPAEDGARAGIMMPAEYCGEDAWYPAAGSISCTTASYTEVGEDGIYWSVTPCGTHDVYGFNFYYHSNDKGYVYHSAMIPKATAASVRCCRER